MSKAQQRLKGTMSASLVGEAIGLALEPSGFGCEERGTLKAAASKECVCVSARISNTARRVWALVTTLDRLVSQQQLIWHPPTTRLSTPTNCR